MTEKEYLNNIAEFKLDAKKIEVIHRLYANHLPNILERIISNCNESIFFKDGTRIISYAEILDAERDLQVDFKKKGLVPIADCGENDFIVYDFINDIWAKFNIVDETLFKKKQTLEDLLK